MAVIFNPTKDFMNVTPDVTDAVTDIDTVICTVDTDIIIDAQIKLLWNN